MPDEGVGRLNSNAVNGLLHVFMKSRGRIRGIYAHNVRLPLLRMCFCFCLFMMHVFSADFSELQASGPYVISSVHPHLVAQASSPSAFALYTSTTRKGHAASKKYA